jgi:hypothetical protein
MCNFENLSSDFYVHFEKQSNPSCLKGYGNKNYICLIWKNF